MLFAGGVALASARTCSTTLAATMTVLIGMFLLGLFDRASARGRWRSVEPREEAARRTKVYFCTELDVRQRRRRQAQKDAVRVERGRPPIRRSSRVDVRLEGRGARAMRRRSPS